MKRLNTASRSFRVIGASIGGPGGGIGWKGQLPWKSLPGDMRRFQERTRGGAVIMGSNTWWSLPEKHRPLKDRLNVVVTSSPTKMHSLGFRETPTHVLAANVNDALDVINQRSSLLEHQRTYVIGGGKIYQQAIWSKRCEAIELTNVDPALGNTTKFDTFFPEIPPHFEKGESEVGEDGIVYELWNNPKDAYSPEHQYLNVLRDIRHNGAEVSDRTGVGTFQSFGVTLRFPLDHPDGRIPLMTSKRVHWKSVAEELLQFARGDINANHLSDLGVSIWKGHTSREHLDSIGGHDVETGSMWKAYGWQWRQLGMPYLGMSAPYRALRRMLTTEDRNERATLREQLLEVHPSLDWASLPSGLRVHDQLANVVEELRCNPSSRRIVLNAWNVSDLDQMCLPPCHMLYTFNVSRGRLNCQMTQRSWDLFLGAPFNIAGTALLVRLLCLMTDLKPGEIKIDACNAHIYSNHVSQVDTQLHRAQIEGLYRFPVLRITKPVRNLEDLEGLSSDDLIVEDYQHLGVIKAPMAI